MLFASQKCTQRFENKEKTSDEEGFTHGKMVNCLFHTKIRFPPAQQAMASVFFSLLSERIFTPNRIYSPASFCYKHLRLTTKNVSSKETHRKVW
ncbi:hypothetical protein SAMN02746098_03600 [Desulfosporosinus lacus DSM 15449]|uniref:Uncharacterized protein n=1 Tax=Desulfosporosinus lacus DSM 15449 TaxID=1121420 RepID=A0A1M5ZRT5_9FIRM|nr:hypothetical protein SAMN02746098_03600 [Desulfosporosinus lacus DSM 15449]